MKVSEAFLVNTKNFEPIIETLANYNSQDIVINSDLLETLSYSDPNDLLVIRILKDFQIIDNDGKPGVHFEEFQNPNTTKQALAKGLVTAYEGIFERNSSVHKNSPDKIKEIFEEYFKGQKTDLIIKYISGTFEKIASYVGISTIDAVLNNDLSEDKTKSETADKSALEETEKLAEATIAENHTANGEEISENNIDDFLVDFEITDSADSSPTSEDESESEDHSSTKDEDSSIQEFIKGFEEADDKENNIKNNTSSEDEVWGLNTNGSKKHIENNGRKSENDIVANSDIAPIDLKMPMFLATQSATNMNNTTNEQKFVQKALIRKSDLLHKMKRWEDLVPTLETIISRYDNQENIEFEKAVEQAIIRRAIALLKLGRTEQALPALNSVIDRFRDSENKEFYEQASRAMLYKVSILEKKDPLNDQLMPLYNAIIDRLESTSEILVNEKLDEIHCKRFDLLIENNEDTSVILEASTKLINRFKENTKFRDYLQKAMMIRAEMLDQMNQDEAALDAYDEFLELFGN